jgi:hypothetical protein
MDPDTKRLEQWLSIGRFCVTSLVTLILVPTFAWGFITKNIDNQVFTQTVGMVLAFWFGAATVASMKAMSQVPTTTTTDTDPSGATRKVTMTASPGAAAPLPVPPDPPKEKP